MQRMIFPISQLLDYSRNYSKVYSYLVVREEQIFSIAVTFIDYILEFLN